MATQGCARQRNPLAHKQVRPSHRGDELGAPGRSPRSDPLCYRLPVISSLKRKNTPMATKR
jgi:hypothetical protein